MKILMILGLAGILVLSNGCGSTQTSRGGFYSPPAIVASAPEVVMPIELPPVASAFTQFGGRVVKGKSHFLGLGLATRTYNDEDMPVHAAMDFSYSQDIGKFMALYVSLGIPCRLEDLKHSHVTMFPISAGVEFSYEYPYFARGVRVYARPAVGYQFDSYDLDSRDRNAILVTEEPGYPNNNYDYEMEGGALFTIAFGAEMYGTDNARTNLALEVQYVSHSAATTETKDSVSEDKSLDLSGWIWRMAVTVGF